MVKFRIPGMSIESNTYKAPSGESYSFFRDNFNGSDVKNDLDIEYFRYKGFKEEGKEIEAPKPKVEVIIEPKKESKPKAVKKK